MQEENPPKEILLNIMGTGEYLDDNLGHEIINLFRDDDGHNNIYVLPYGTFDAKHKDRIEVILLAQRVGDDCVQILAKAWRLNQTIDLSLDVESLTKQQEVFCSQISYGGTPLPQIFSGNRTNASKNALVFVSFQAGEFRMASKRIFITDKREKADDKSIFFIPKNLPKSSPKSYYAKDETGDQDNTLDIQGKSSSYDVLYALIQDPKLWEAENRTEKVNVKELAGTENTFNFLRLIRKEDDELSFSNLFAHYFKMSQRLCGSFVRDVLKIVDAKNDFEVAREFKHIDLLLTDEEYVIVIENKIKSKINGIRHDINGKIVHSQLQEYMNVAEEMANGRAVRYFILSPDYNQIKLDVFPNGQEYKPVFYSQILDFLEHFYTPQSVPDAYYADFLRALKKHVSGGTLHYEMRERFIDAIRYKGIWRRD